MRHEMSGGLLSNPDRLVIYSWMMIQDLVKGGASLGQSGDLVPPRLALLYELGEEQMEKICFWRLV